MDWINGLQKAIEYIEEHLTDKLKELKLGKYKAQSVRLSDDYPLKMRNKV